MNKHIPWQLIISRLKDGQDERGEKLFVEWLQGEGNAHLYQELEGLWREIREEASSYTPDTAFYWQQLESRMSQENKAPKVVSIWKFRMAVAAASILLIISLTFSFLYTGGDRAVYSNKLSYSALSGKSRIVLPDSSVVWLNSGSLLVYDKHFRGKRRLLFLNGEARFQVAKDPAKPFLVKTAHMTVKALGTVFNLNAYSDQDVTIATLEEGKIQVYPCLKQDTSLILSPDEQIIYNHRLETLALNTVDAGRVMQWTDGYLIFQTASFDQIVKTIERKFDVTINYETERFAGRSFTMKFNPDEGLEQVLEVMKEMIKGLNYKIKEDKVYIN